MRTLRSHLALVILLVASPAVGQNTQPVSDQSATRPYHMLVLGDSISWGQGLKTENKAWYHVKIWLEKSTGRAVIEKVEAHSGAVIERSSGTDNYGSTNPEVNVAQPTLHDEIDNALRASPRSASCNEVFREQPNETADQKKERKSRRMLCRYAALGHPNRKGALLYADAIINSLKTIMPVTSQ